ncbi:TetR/AcrR family transcriptional regulator [Paenibacillus sp. NEAU-GSW1]|uniref:TetR/AcrR family transcriptional regulator n=1 Tax=Paenibacillus sp. NEAU-GSW1 TaxID=2682486 RepID=UPI001563D1AB|nr:TetR/AcrR family transcriptional regulator [Paenibacillus sp. NEAU-GSW1]
MEEKADLRKKRTKRLLRTALLELVEEKGLERVTVRDLTERAEINRGTFYLHYRDVPDFMERLSGEIFDGMKSLLTQLNPYEIKQYAEKGVPYPGAVQVLNYVAQNADYFRVILGPNGDTRFSMKVKEFMSDHLYSHVFSKASDEFKFPRDYLIAFITSANIGLYTHWILNGMSMPVEELALFITRILYKGPLAVAEILK